MKKASLGVGNGIRLAAAVATVCLLASSHAMATNLFWSANGTTQGGAGTWTTTTPRFATAAAGTPAGTYGVTWNNANVDSAEFGGTAGTVNLTGPITVNTITTDVAGFTIGNGNGTGGSGNTLTFSGANAGVNTTHTSGTTFLTAVVSGTLTKTGVGRLELNNTANPTTSKYVINAGIISTPGVSRFGTNAPGALVPDFLTFNGGGWGINTTNQDTGANRGITIKSGGAFFGSTSTTLNVTISSPIVGTEGGGISIVGNSGPFLNSAHLAGAIVILNNTGNSFDGNITLNGGSGSSLRTALSNVIPNTALVTISAAGNTLDLGTNGTTDSIKSISGTAGTIVLGSAGKLTVLNPAGETYSSVFTGTSGSQFIKEGAGALTLSGGSSGFSGEMVLNNGTLGVGGTGAFGSAAGAQLTITGGKLSNNSSSGRTMSTNLAVNLNGNFTVDDSLSATQGQIAFGGTNTIKNSNRTITVDGTANLAFTSAIGQDVAGRSLTKDGIGTLVLNAVNTYSGDTTITKGLVSINSTATLGDGTGNLKLNGGTLNETASRSGSGQIVANAVQVTDNSSITSSAAAGTPIFEFSGALTGTAGKTLTFQDNAAAATQFKPRFSGSFTMDAKIDMPTGTGALAATSQLESFNTTATTQTFTGVISGTGSYNRSASASLTGGDTVFTAANTYSGGTIVNRGSLTVTNTTGSGTGTGGITVNAEGVLNVGNGAANGAVSGNIGDGGIVNFNRSDSSSYGSATVSISGAGVVNKKGAGTLSLPNANSHSGGTKQFDGGLNLGDMASLGTGTYTIGDATTTTTLKVSSSANLTGANAVANAVTVAKDFTVASGSSDLELSGAVGLGAVNRTITVDSSNATILSGVISDTGGTGGITKAGSGVLTLTGANTYGTAGVTSTFVTGGKLRVSNTTGSGTGPGNVSVTAGVLGGTGSIAGSVTVSGTGVLSPGASINVLGIGGNLTMTGGSFDYEINRDVAPAVGADLNNVTGNLSLATVALSAADLGVGAVPLVGGTKFTLINYGGTWNGGIFTGLANHSTSLVIGLNRFQIDYDATTGGSNFGGGSVGAGSHFVTITAVPEASTFLTIGLGGIFAIAAVWMSKRMGLNVLKA